ncbi:MAG: DEAD/DEAH box helicase, partial [Persicimonas sp.]
MSATAKANFFARYDLTARRAPDKTPAAHQHEALDALYRWHETYKGKDAGGILTIPTGGGKTFTAVRFLCREPLSNGYKVLWLAHTHHLLEQAFGAFGEGAKHIQGRSGLNVRTVSGTPGHWPVSRIEATDDVVLGTLQTLTRAYDRKVEALEAFIDEAGDRLVVVFDEAHHSPANTYRKLLLKLRERVPAVHLLGMTATPTYTDEEKRGWLGELFPQGILYPAGASKLIAAGVLAKPRIEEVKLDFTPQFDAAEYDRWSRTNRDLPQSVIDQLADSRTRNLRIVEHYVKHRERYGKTLVFCDRATQCVALEEAFKKRDVRADSVYSHTTFDGRTAEERNRRTRDHNAKAIAAFKNGDLDVLMNIRILTEGTDVPDAETVFLTRQSTSRILLTQMVGRAMRGPKFGGTAEAHIVSFIDDWKHLIHWADVTELTGGLDDTEPEYGERPPIQLISVELVRRLARQMDTGVNVNALPYTELLPVGWYRVEYEAPGDYDDIEQVRELLIVYDDQHDAFDELITELESGAPEVFNQD